MYDPAVGRFLSEDPLGFDAEDANLGRYVGNDPVNRTDPTGLAEEKPDFNYRVLEATLRKAASYRVIQGGKPITHVSASTKFVDVLKGRARGIIDATKIHTFKVNVIAERDPATNRWHVKVDDLFIDASLQVAKRAVFLDKISRRSTTTEPVFRYAKFDELKETINHEENHFDRLIERPFERMGKVVTSFDSYFQKRYRNGTGVLSAAESEDARRRAQKVAADFTRDLDKWYRGFYPIAYGKEWLHLEYTEGESEGARYYRSWLKGLHTMPSGRRLATYPIIADPRVEIIIEKDIKATKRWYGVRLGPKFAELQRILVNAQKTVFTGPPPGP